jgi:transcriptional regulator NrdR family protein
MKCPKCNSPSRVYETRQSTESVTRRRVCEGCFTRFTTHERIAWVTGQKPKDQKAEPSPKEIPVKKPIRTKAVKREESKRQTKHHLDVFFKESLDVEDLGEYGIDVGRGYLDDF